MHFLYQAIASRNFGRIIVILAGGHSSLSDIVHSNYKNSESRSIIYRYWELLLQRGHNSILQACHRTLPFLLNIEPR